MKICRFNSVCEQAVFGRVPDSIFYRVDRRLNPFSETLVRTIRLRLCKRIKKKIL